jgi:glycosyltransferase involved in cell wall biosynthesis
MTAVVVDLERLKFLQCGLGQFSLHLGMSLLDERTADFEPVLLLPRCGESLFPGRSFRSMTAAAWRKDRFCGWLSPLAARWPASPSYDLWHVTHQDSKYWPIDPRIPVVLTIHDLNFLREKPLAVIRRRLRRLQRKITRATVLTTGSQFSAQEIREHLDVQGKSIQVIPHGVCLDTSARPQRPEIVPAERPFLFAIGDITPKKNFHVLVEMLNHLPKYRLVIAGSNSHDYARRIERRAIELELDDRVILTGRVSDSERNWLYDSCSAFLFPSLTEGFGLPLIEAMSHGKPVFSSSATSLPEVGGPLAFYWTEFEPRAMAAVFSNGMEMFHRDPAYPDKLKAHASRFSWSEAAREYLKLYREVVRKEPAPSLSTRIRYASFNA